MDPIKIGKFIAELRKEYELTQEQLGEKIGVTNKTISRWETGAYMPPVDALLSMSELFSISINEILSGKRLSTEEYKLAAEENLAYTIASSSDSLKERMDFYKKKWLKEHIAIMVFIGICLVSLFVAGIILKKSVFVPITMLCVVIAHAWRNNTMMAYVEKNAFDGNGKP